MLPMTIFHIFILNVTFTHPTSSIFQAESNQSIFRILENDLHVAGGQVQKEPWGVHHVGDGVVQITSCKSLKPNFSSWYPKSF